MPPRLIRVRSPRPDLDIITTETDPPTPDQWRKTSPDLARILGAHTIRVRPTTRGRAELWAYRTDPLREPVPPLEPATTVDQLQRIPVGIREDGQVFTLPLLYNHLFVAGETGSGKGSVLWSAITGIAPLIHTGHVELWVADPKQGLEFVGGRHLFAEFVWQPTDIADLLDDAVVGLRRRGDRMREPGHPGKEPQRKHTPTTKHPHIVVVIDEIASLTQHPDRDLRRRYTDALFLLLSQGRAAAITVIAATQDARQDTLGGLRTYIPTAVALRMREANQTAMILGPGARDRGALTDRISRDTPGVGYVSLEGEPDPVRVRFSHITDQHIADTATRYAPPTRTETHA